MADPRWPPFRKNEVIPTSCDVIKLCCDIKGNKSKRTIYPRSFVAVAFILSELTRGHFVPYLPPHPPGPGTKNKNKQTNKQK